MYYIFPESHSFDDHCTPYLSQLTDEQISQLSNLIGDGWIKLANYLDMPYAAGSQPGLLSAQEACSTILSLWCDLNKTKDRVRLLRNALLEAELFNEEVAAVLAKPDEIEMSSSEDVTAESEERVATPVQDENEPNVMP
ncbi:unnamed protein product [Soboliphyme baturini]|uniref:Death domain-containing protein n=1 Tax=Soboliphyme baturini TaxID=241478 RepID=A0A183J8W8_9BILA|nr:unnamed protein product [Soboliphyme baturini]